MSAGAEMLGRNGGLRIAEYSVYPRTARDHCVQEAFTRTADGNELVRVTNAPELVGELLRVRIQGIETRDGRETLARVAACNEVGESRFELLLEALDARAPKRVRRNLAPAASRTGE